MLDSLDRYHESVDYLQMLPQVGYPKKGSRSLFLQRTAYFLKLLGNPHRGRRYIHVGGTSGKGSVAIMIHSILTADHYRAGLYLSPHPTTTIERFKVGNYFIAPDEFTAIVEKIKPMIEHAYQHSPYGGPSHFEILTAVAFLYFKQKKCTHVVLEVGLGGRHDATNIISHADVTVINRIGHDHTQLLGRTLPEIAREKAAIIKPGTAFFTTAQNPTNILTIFQKTCQKKRASYHVVGSPTTPYPLTLLGNHQQYNAEIAAQVTAFLGIKRQTIIKGLRATRLSCRLEVVAKKPMIILDGAHNNSKMESVTQTLKNLTYKKLYLIIALAKSRNPADVFKKIIPFANHVIVTRFQSNERRCLSPSEVAKKLKTDKPIEIFLDANHALDRALALAGPKDIIIITGSFYLAGELRQRWRPETKILTQRIS